MRITPREECVSVAWQSPRDSLNPTSNHFLLTTAFKIRACKCRGALIAIPRLAASFLGRAFNCSQIGSYIEAIAKRSEC